MRIGVLQTGGPPPELAQRFGTYPAMLETLLAGGERRGRARAGAASHH